MDGHGFHEACWRDVPPPPRCPTCRAAVQAPPLVLTRRTALEQALADADEVRRRFGPKVAALTSLLPRLGKAVVSCTWPTTSPRC